MFSLNMLRKQTVIVWGSHKLMRWFVHRLPQFWDKRLTRGEQTGNQAETLKMTHAWTELNALKYGQQLTSQTTASLFVKESFIFNTKTESLENITAKTHKVISS